MTYPTACDETHRIRTIGKWTRRNGKLKRNSQAETLMILKKRAGQGDIEETGSGVISWLFSSLPVAMTYPTVCGETHRIRTLANVSLTRRNGQTKCVLC